MLKIPYGVSGFESIREEGYEYIDKTRYIEKIEKERYCMYVRPRRFGKTLFTTMLDAYYAIDKKDKFEALFKGLYIYDTQTNNKNNYYIMNFDFSGMLFDNSMNLQEIENAFNMKVYNDCMRFIERYRLDISLNENYKAATMLETLLRSFQGLHLDNNIYIIIDEYDHFTNGLLEGNCEKFLNILGKAGFVRAFYEVIKTYTKYNVVERFFGTGVAPITLDSMTSGFNITTSLTLNQEYIDMTGLNETEVRNLVNKVESAPEKQEEIYKELKENYDGYIFSKKNLQHIFNPTLVMYYLDNYIKLGSKPEDMIDKNLTTNAEKLRNLIQMVNKKQNYEIVEELMLEGAIEGKILQSFELDKRFGREDFLSMLFYNGYITIKSYDDLATVTTFTIPNYISKKLYAEYMLSLVQEDKRYEMSSTKLEIAIAKFARQGDIVDTIEYIKEFLMYCGVRDRENFNETNLKHIIQWLFAFSRAYFVYSEYPSLQGFSDLFVKNADSSRDLYQAVIELKYIPKKDGTKENIKRVQKEAREQMKEYLKDERLSAEHKLKAYAITFVGFENYYLEEIELEK